MNYEETKIELEYLIARHINDDSVRVAVLKIRESKILVSVKKTIPKWYNLKISHTKKLIIDNKDDDYFVEKILEVESDIIDIMSNFEEEFMFQVNGVWQIV
jgi:hypothetical protein